MPRNLIQIRHGTGVPDENDLLPYELGYSKETGSLYIGAEEIIEDDSTVIKQAPIQLTRPNNILTEDMYGDSLPASGTKGQLYYVKLQDSKGE